MASTPSGTNGGRCDSNIFMPATLSTDRSRNLDHSSSDFLYHFGQRFQRQGPPVRRGSGVPEDQRRGLVPAGLPPVAVGVPPVPVDPYPPPPRDQGALDDEPVLPPRPVP